MKKKINACIDKDKGEKLEASVSPSAGRFGTSRGFAEVWH